MTSLRLKTLMKLIRSPFILLLLLVATLSSCSSLKPLEYRSINNIYITGNSGKAQLAFDLNLYNPNSVGAKLKEFNVEVELDGVKIATAQLLDVTHAGSQSEFTIPVSLNTSFQDMMRFLPSGISMLSGADIPIHLNGSLTVKKFIFRKTFPFDVKETLDTGKIRLGK